MYEYELGTHKIYIFIERYRELWSVRREYREHRQRCSEPPYIEMFNRLRVLIWI